jgi:hypothetical protein
VILVLPLLLQVCSSDVTDPDGDQVDLSGGWELRTTVTSNTCGLQDGVSETEVIELTETNGPISIINFDGNWGTAEVDGNTVTFSGSEDSRDFGCTATLTTQGSGTYSETLISGTLTTTVGFDQDSCSDFSDCIIASDFEMTRLDDSPCLSRALFGDPALSEYVLPYPAGASYPVYQSYCWATGGHRNQLAYDFTMPIGDAVVAARRGVVRAVKEDSPDDGQGVGEHNCVHIEHVDGTAAFYAHLMQHSVSVEPGDTVEVGQQFASSGNSGYSGEPHLHFGVYQDYPPVEGFDVPVNFRNAEGPIDSLGGLIRGQVYEATQY